MRKNPPAWAPKDKRSAALRGAERRGEPRRPLSATVWLSFQDPQPHELELQLLDISASGFRTSDTNVDLASGQYVRFRHGEGSGHARVVWHRVLPDHVETGFLVVNAV
jgi:hypothetical protein